MFGSSIGNIFKITTWGESHGKAVGVVVDGCPAGLPLSEEDIQIFLNRRKPGQSPYATPRNEADKVEILSGIFEGKQPGHRFPCSFGIHRPVLPIIRRLPNTTVRDMPTILLSRNTVSAITAAADAPPP